MNKKEFLNELSNRLKGLPKEDIEERINFYSEMIDDRVEEGMTEEEAINNIGSVDDVIRQIASETPLARLAKEKVKPKRRLNGFEVILLVLGFPIWFPLCITALTLMLVCYLLIWLFVLIIGALDFSLIASSVTGVIAIFGSIADGKFNIGYLGVALLGLGLGILLVLGLIEAIKITAKISSKIFIGIKSNLIGGNKNE